MKYLLLLLSVVACDGDGGSYDTVFYRKQYRSCVPLYTHAHTASDSLLIDMYRPEDARYGESCAALRELSR